MLDCGRQRVGGIDNAERAVAVAARPVERDAVAFAAHPAGRDVVAVTRTVDRNERPDTILVAPLREQVPHAAEGARPFLANVRDEQDVARRTDRGGVHRAGQRQQRCHPLRIVTNPRGRESCSVAPHRHIGPFGEHGVEMRGDDQQRTSSAGAHSEDVALFVLLDVGESGCLGEAYEGVGAGRLLEGRCGNFRQGDDFRDEAVVLAIDDHAAARYAEFSSVRDADSSAGCCALVSNAHRRTMSTTRIGSMSRRNRTRRHDTREVAG